MLAEPNTFWLGAEYFCNEDDELWRKDDKELLAFVIDELVSIGIIEEEDYLDGKPFRIKKAYPSYTGAYQNFEEIKKFLNDINNCFPIGRNGMHKYNNQDHSMLSAMKAVELIANNDTDKTALWEINTEEEYLEEKK